MFGAVHGLGGRCPRLAPVFGVGCWAWLWRWSVSVDPGVSVSGQGALVSDRLWSVGALVVGCGWRREWPALGVLGGVQGECFELGDELA